MKNPIGSGLCILFLFPALFSCSSHQAVKREAADTISAIPSPVREQLKTGEVITSVRCENDPTQAYALYLPGEYNGTTPYPVIIFFDPHGSGSYPAGLYKSWAERYGYILMGSNNSKNGVEFSEINHIINALLAEASSRFQADGSRVALAGFSGGAKAALAGALNHPGLLSVIFCGASIPMESVQQLPPALGFAGLSDMNYTEVLTAKETLDKKNIFHEVIEWKGKHEWPDSATFEYAFWWCSFNAMRNKSTPPDAGMISKYLQKENSRLSAERNPLEKHDTYARMACFLTGLADLTAYRDKMNTLEHSVSFRKEMLQHNAALQEENNLKQNYSQCLESKDLDWWKNEIERMRKVTGAAAPVYQRLLGYLSLASYTYSNNAIRQNNDAAAEHFLALYKLADPENPEQPFLVACLLARKGEHARALEALKESVRLGLKDKQKIQAEESFGPLRSDAGFNELLGKL